MIVEIAVGLFLLILVAALIKFTAELRSISFQFQKSVHDAEHHRDRLEATIDRMERATEVVAVNLADSVSRADATDGPEGAAADAALRTGDTAEAIHKRQDDLR